jgi:hypothetical protein
LYAHQNKQEDNTMKKLDHNVAVKTAGMTEEQYDKIVEIMGIYRSGYDDYCDYNYLEFWEDQGDPKCSSLFTTDGLEEETKEILTAEEFINKYGDNGEGEVVMNNSKSGEHDESPISFEFGGAETGVLTLADVEEDQFFVDKQGYLCQKLSRCDYVRLARASGLPHCDYFGENDSDMVIQRVLPKVTKINF